jgi:hypothetical protein
MKPARTTRELAAQRVDVLKCMRFPEDYTLVSVAVPHKKPGLEECQRTEVNGILQD